MGDDRLVKDAGRFLVVGALNSALTCLVYLAGLAIVSPAVSYTVAWFTGLILATVFYPDRVFPGGRTSIIDRMAMGTSLAVTFLFGLVSLHLLRSTLQNTVAAFFVTLALTTALNFLASRWIFRRPC